MKFGIFYGHQLPRPWQPDDEHRLLEDAREQVDPGYEIRAAMKP